MKKNGWEIFLLLLVTFLSKNLSATILSDMHLGLMRPALQDSIFDDESEDPYRILGNPAWAPRKSTVAVSSSLVGAQMNSLVPKEDNSYLLSFMYQERKGQWGFGAFSVLPTSTQPILDTGSELQKSSPWMNMTRQISYAANVSRHGEKWSVGLLLPVYFNATAEAQTNLATANVDARARLYLKPKLSYGVGALYRLDDGDSVSLSYKEQATAKATAIFESNIPILSLDLLFEGDSSYAFDPRRLMLSYSQKTSFGYWGARIRYSQWSKFSTPYIEVTESSLTLVDASPSGKAKDAFDGTMAILWKVSPSQKWAFSAGYQESPFSQISSYYDSDQLKLAVAYSYLFPGDWSLSSHFRWHLLNRGASYLMAGFGLSYTL